MLIKFVELLNHNLGTIGAVRTGAIHFPVIFLQKLESFLQPKHLLSRVNKIQRKQQIKERQKEKKEGFYYFQKIERKRDNKYKPDEDNL